MSAQSYKDILKFSRDDAGKLVITVAPDFDWEALKAMPARPLPQEGELALTGLNPDVSLRNKIAFKHTDFLKGKISESLQDERFQDNPELTEKFISTALFGKRDNHGFRSKEYITSAGRELLTDFEKAGPQKKSRWDNLTKALAPSFVTHDVLKKNGVLSVREGELTLSGLQEQLHIPHKTLVDKTAKMLNVLLREEVVLLRAQKITDSLAASLPQNDGASDTVVRLQQALSTRQEQRQYYKDIAPRIQDVVDHLDIRSHPKEVIALKELLDIDKFNQRNTDTALTEQAKDAVSVRFGGLRWREGQHNARVLTPEGVDVLVERYPYAPKAKEVKKSSEPKGQATDNTLFQVINRMVKADSLPAPEIPETFVAESGTVEQSRVGVVTHHGGGRVVHRGNYGREV